MRRGILFIISFFFLFSPPCFSGESYYSYGAGKERIDGAGTIYYYVNDQVDSARVILKEDQSVEWSSDYQPFGQEVNVQGAGGTEDKTFSGKEHDQTGLYYFGARYYDPGTGRFTSRDPAGEFASPYVYVGNNPMGHLDSDGTQSKKAGVFDYLKFLPLMKSIKREFEKYDLNTPEGLANARRRTYIIASHGISPYPAYKEILRRTTPGTYTGYVPQREHDRIQPPNGSYTPNPLAMYLMLEDRSKLPISKYRPTSLSNQPEIFYDISQWSRVAGFSDTKEHSEWGKYYIWPDELLIKLLHMKIGDILGREYVWGFWTQVWDTNWDLGKFTQSFGRDDKGIYLSIYDSWDFVIEQGGAFNWFRGVDDKVNATLMDKIGVPIPIYMRYYLDRDKIKSELKSRGVKIPKRAE